MTVYEETGQAIEKIRKKKKGMSQADMSTAIGVTIPTYWRVITGRRICLSTVHKVLAFLPGYGFSLNNFDYDR